MYILKKCEINTGVDGKMKEGTLVKEIRTYMEDKGAYMENIWGGGYQAAGIPDLIGCYKGTFVGIEVKLDYNKPSKLQEVKLQMINNAGGEGIVAYGIDDVEKMIERIDANE